MWLPDPTYLMHHIPWQSKNWLVTHYVDYLERHLITETAVKNKTVNYSNPLLNNPFAFNHNTNWSIYNATFCIYCNMLHFFYLLIYFFYTFFTFITTLIAISNLCTGLFNLWFYIYSHSGSYLRHGDDHKIQPIPWISQECEITDAEASGQHLYKRLKGVDASENVPKSDQIT